MADNVNKALEDMLQFTNRTDRARPVTFDDLQPLINAKVAAIDPYV